MDKAAVSEKSRSVVAHFRSFQTRNVMSEIWLLNVDILGHQMLIGIYGNHNNYNNST